MLTFSLIPFEERIVKDSFVIITSAPSFINSVFKASNRSVSFIFKVCKPAKWHSKPNPKQVTAMVCAISGEFCKLYSAYSME